MTDLAAARTIIRPEPGESKIAAWGRWIERKLIDAGEPPRSIWWAEKLAEFDRSRATSFAAGVGQRGGKSTDIIAYRLLPVALFGDHKPVYGAELVIPVLSVDLREANGRQATAIHILKTIGMTQEKTRADVDRAGAFFASPGTPQQPGECIIGRWDRVGIKLRTQPASSGGASGFTAPAVLADELGLWSGEKESPRKVLEALQGRRKGVSEAYQYNVSRPFSETDELTKMIRGGSNEGLFVASLGAAGSTANDVACEVLRGHLISRASQGDNRSAAYAFDPRLKERLSPSSVFVPAWVALPIGLPGDYGPGPAILECWRLAVSGEGLLPGESPIDGLFRAYGGRPIGNEGASWYDGNIIETMKCRDALAEALNS
jgi:hypothetical protein